MTEQEIFELVKYRLQQAETAVEDGRFLLEGRRSPQSILNRAYYAMFYAALALLQKIGKVPSKHTGVINLFDTEFVVQGIFPKELSKDFHKAFELRQVFDYRVLAAASPEKAKELLQKAERLKTTSCPPLKQNQIDDRGILAASSCRPLVAQQKGPT